MGNCFKKPAKRQKRQKRSTSSSRSSESYDSNEPLKPDNPYRESFGYQNTYVNLGVNGWSGRGIRCDGLNGYCDGRGSDCSGRRPSLHPNAFADRKNDRLGRAGAGAIGGAFALAGGGAAGRLGDGEDDVGGCKDRLEVGPRESVRVGEGEDPGGCDTGYDGGACSFYH